MWLLLLLLFFLQLLKISLFEDEQVAYKAWKPHGVHSMYDVEGCDVWV